MAVLGLPRASAARTVMRVGYDQDVVKLDPGVAQATVDVFPSNLIFGRLVNYDRTMLRPTPDVAESWQLSPDGLTYTFKIRRGVLFHTGRELTAEDVEWSFRRGFDLGPKGRFAGYMVSVGSYKTTDRYEFQIKLKQPDASFLPNLAVWAASIYDQKTIDRIETQPVGTGPYTFVEWIPGEKVRYAKFKDYWDKTLSAKWPDEIVTIAIPEELTRIASLKSGQVDLIANISPQFWKDIESTKGLQLLRQDFSASFTCVAFNVRRPPFDNVKLRQGLLRAVDRESINKNVFFGAGKPGCSLIPQGHWAYADLGCPSFDLAAAKALVEQSGARLPLRVKARVFNKPDWPIKLMEIVQRDWQRIGVEMEIEAIEFGFYVKDVWVAKNADLTLAWYTREADPDGMFSSVLRKDQGNNFMGYHNAAVEEMFDAAKAPTDRAKRKTSYERLLRQAMLEDVPLIKVQTVEIAWAASNKVQGLVVQPKGTPNIYEWEWRG